MNFGIFLPFIISWFFRSDMSNDNITSNGWTSDFLHGVPEQLDFSFFERSDKRGDIEVRYTTPSQKTGSRTFSRGPSTSQEIAQFMQSTLKTLFVHFTDDTQQNWTYSFKRDGPQELANLPSAIANLTGMKGDVGGIPVSPPLRNQSERVQPIGVKQGEENCITGEFVCTRGTFHYFFGPIFQAHFLQSEGQPQENGCLHVQPPSDPLASDNPLTDDCQKSDPETISETLVSSN